MPEDSKPKKYPTPFQRRTVWAGLTAFFLVVIGAIAVGLVWLFTFTMGILQPVLVPLAVAGVLAYLLNPLVTKLINRGIDQKKASFLVFVSFIAAGGILLISIALPVSKQAAYLIRDFPGYIKKFEQTLDKSTATLKTEYHDHAILGPIVAWLPDEDTIDPSTPPAKEPVTTLPTTEAPPAQPTDPAPTPTPPDIPNTSSPLSEPLALRGSQSGDRVDSPDAPPSFQPGKLRSWLLEQLPVIGNKIWAFVKQSIGGFLGAFGFVLGFFLVPVYLFFFLREAPHIRATWSDYVPLRASEFKNEVVGTLTEINGYLISFFRGQMLVSLIDGLITAVLLSIIGLKFGLLIGVLVGILGVIPYLGIMMCYIPAIIIATVQGANHDWYMAQAAPWWVLPLIVTFVFIAVNNLDGIFIAPKIVGESVGLHPFTVIFSVLFWSLLLGGLLGAVLAVPLTASIKVLFMRYVWERRVKPGVIHHGAPPGNEPPAAAPLA